MIEVKGLVKLYGERKVLHGLNFTVGKGRVCGLLGPNGSGKSTTMDILAGLLGQSAGQVSVCGFDVITQTKDVKAHVGYLPDNPPLYKEMKVKEFVDYVAKIRGLNSKNRKTAVQRVLEECDVTDVCDRIIGNLSKGYRQRVALCSALVHQPQVLILDEPTEGLDPNQILHIRTLIKKLSKERTVILSSHILSEVQASCDEVIIINKGHLVAKTVISSEENKFPAYCYTFGEKSENILTWFKTQPYIHSARFISENKSSIIVEFKAEFWKESQPDHLAKVTKEIVQNNFSLIGIQIHRTGLEELFFKAIG
ncbi:MAG: ABC transporter ATP-binding protein [Silvanigrellaceae bacterium]|nr:ABC transporter ATP-binding protein [Silvanigrellaceae bacterium]